MQKIAFFIADPNHVFFVIPYLNHPVTWYGLLFAFGFLVGYFLVKKIFVEKMREKYSKEESEERGTYLADRLAMIMVIGTVIGARFGHVFFYDWSFYKENPWAILKVWEGGLASHGGALGIIIGIFIFTLIYRKKYKELTFMMTLDSIVVAAAFAGGCIRIGNFLNQEILGKPTTLPWGVSFLHPMDGPRGIPLHPVQLYESFFYFATFILLFTLWKRGKAFIGSGLLTGLFLFLVFTFRFFIEFFKLPLSQLDGATWLNMGQFLSLPFILLGALLLFRAKFKLRSF